ncbi:hypothetical protein [Metasolibacillus meyeri]|uniref:hypothetical protein n=1 Tax=Metasolibacillus meyeri TaxID=1071052 RepID=UPI000D31CF03|nr:hypothetical protein [Metasolibacillus meyeri]
MTYLLIEELKRQFSNDLLYKYLQQGGVKESDLFPEYINQISMDRLYSTPEVAAMFKIGDNNLRYLMQIMRELGYINSLKAGRNYRFDYLNIYRMHLVRLILSIEGRNTGDIANILKGNVSEVNSSLSEQNLGNNDVSLSKLEIQIIEKQLAIYELQTILYETTRKYMQQDQNFNLMLLEFELMNKLNGSIKTTNKKWFAKSFDNDSSSVNPESKNQLIESKEQLATLLFDINDYEKQLTLNLYELKRMFEEKKQILLNTHK